MDSSEIERLQFYVREYRTQLVEGCDDEDCTSKFCARGSGKKMAPSTASIFALQLATMYDKKYVCAKKLMRPGPALKQEDVNNDSATSIIHSLLRTTPFQCLFKSFSENYKPRDRHRPGSARKSMAVALSTPRRRGSSIGSFTADTLIALIDEAESNRKPGKLIYQLQTVFSSSWSLSGCFWKLGLLDDHDSILSQNENDSEIFSSSTFNPTVDTESFNEFLEVLYSTPAQRYKLTQIVGNAVMLLMERSQYWCSELPIRRQLHLFALIMELVLFQRHAPPWSNLVSFSSLLRPALRSAPQHTKDAMVLYLANFPTEKLEQLVGLFQNDISLIRPFRGMCPEIHDSAHALHLLYRVNQTRAESCDPNIIALPSSAFWNPQFSSTSDGIDFKEEYSIWRKQMREASLDKGSTSDQNEDYQGSILQYPFLLNAAAKYRVLRIDAAKQMGRMFKGAVFNQAWVRQAKQLAIGHKSPDNLMPAVQVAMNPYVVFEVRRDHLIEDTLAQVTLSLKDLKKPLRIKYVGGGEEGLDLGGVQKEFFQLLMEKIFDPMNAMFEYYEESKTFWINGGSLESEREFELVGILIGLAIYNGVTLDIHFPMVIYKKLLGFTPKLADLIDAQPSLGRGLQQLLDYDGDVQEVFDMNFQIDQKQFDHVEAVDLIQNGKDVPVTNENRHEFVALYVKYILETSVEKQFEALHRGLHFVCGGPAINIFSPDELELVVCGSPNLDFQELENGATYEGGYTRQTPVIMWLWEVVHQMSNEDQRRFLHYVTGSGRIPIKGLSTVDMVIQQNGGHSDRLPTALTCFSRLLLPKYASKAHLRDRLMLAIEHGKGFGLV